MTSQVIGQAAEIIELKARLDDRNARIDELKEKLESADKKVDRFRDEKEKLGTVSKKVKGLIDEINVKVDFGLPKQHILNVLNAAIDPKHQYHWYDEHMLFANPRCDCDSCRKYFADREAKKEQKIKQEKEDGLKSAIETLVSSLQNDKRKGMQKFVEQITKIKNLLNSGGSDNE